MMSRRRRSPLSCQETVQPHAKAAGFNITLIRAIRSDGKLSLIKLILAGGDDHRGGFNSIHLPSHPSGTRPTPHPQRLNVTTIRRIDRFNETFQVLKWTNRVRPRNGGGGCVTHEFPAWATRWQCRCVCCGRSAQQHGKNVSLASS